MAIALNNLHHFLLLILLTLSSIFILQTHHNLVEADDKFIQQKCRDTEVPSLCIQCIKSDPGGKEADTTIDVATIAIKCLSNHAEILVKNMSKLASMYPSEKKFVAVCESCNKGYSKAKKTLLKADENLKNGDYDDANHLLTLALGDGFVQSCEPGLDPYKEKMVGVGYEIFYQMKVYEELTGIAMAIIDRLV